MSEYPIPISNLNDFIYCPVSIYFHLLEDSDNILYQDSVQLNGTASHRASDLAVYSTKKSVLQGTWVYCEKYNLYGKIDIFDISNGCLTERKKMIKTIYDGYVFQLYAQYFALLEAGYKVNEIRLYSMGNNKVHRVDLPCNNIEMFTKFILLIDKINNFSFKDFRQENIQKCSKCIYEPLCSFSLLKG